MTVISGPGELVALVPRLLGFHPHESVVTVLLGRGGAVLAALRVDRSDVLALDGPELALQVAAAAAREGAARAVVLGFTHRLDGPRCEAMDRVADALADTVGEVGSWRVAEGRFACPDCTDPRCCPPGGLPVPAPGPASTALWWHARAEPDLRGAPAGERRKCVRAFERWQARKAATEPSRWREVSLESWRAALSGASAGPAALGRVIAGLSDVRVRDAALLTLVPGADQAVRDACDGLDSEAVAAALGSGLRPSAAPDRELAERAGIVLADVLDHVTGERAAPAAGMLAVLAWWTSDRARAMDWCEVALALDPGYRLAALVRALIGAVDV